MNFAGRALGRHRQHRHRRRSGLGPGAQARWKARRSHRYSENHRAPPGVGSVLRRARPEPTAGASTDSVAVQGRSARFPALFRASAGAVP